MSLALWREAMESPRFALMNFSLVAVSAGILWLFPDFWLAALLIALIPWGCRVAAGMAPLQRTAMDWLIAVFVLSALAGWWASYDKTIAGNKLSLLMMSVLLFYALSAQPKENLIWVSSAMFLVGIGVAIYFFLTNDFLASPRKLEIVNSIGARIMQFKPTLGWKPIHPNYVAGISAIASVFVVYPLWLSRSSKRNFLKILTYAVIALGLGVIAFTIFMTTSRGVIMAMASLTGVWILWKIIASNSIRLPLAGKVVFPSLVLVYLAVCVALLYVGPAQDGGDVATPGLYGTGSRAELFDRSLYFLSDFPFTGGGLGTFPALYSHYILDVPSYFLPNAHNLFLDVFIEQGIFGGIAFLALYVACIWQTARGLTRSSSPDMRVFGALALAALIISLMHGMVDDYLYFQTGAILSLVLPGIAVSFMGAEDLTTDRVFVGRLMRPLSLATVVLLLGLGILNWSRIQSAWFANIGAVAMAKVELAGFPTNTWTGSEIATKLESAEASLHSALEADPTNRTANHRLGLIMMLQQDFEGASQFLETAFESAPSHRGILKSLGYSYAWNGEFDRAIPLLERIPESKDELDVYIWWWTTQGRGDLSEQSSVMLGRMEAIP